MEKQNQVDDSREEHRMLIRLNDVDPVSAKMIIGERHGLIKNAQGIVHQKSHEKPYTVTFYATSKYYGITSKDKLKPRVRLSREKKYDNVSSGAPVYFPDDALLDFVEFKHKNNNSEPADAKVLEETFSDGPVLEEIERDSAMKLVSQHDTFLMQPPVKGKVKITGSVAGKGGILIGEFLYALNNPSKANKIFSKYQHGDIFAKELLSALEPFKGLEFEFGIYSRYRRLDCVYTNTRGIDDPNYRTTFDPFTALGWIKDTPGGRQLQPLINERTARWEHKINPAGLNSHVLKRISTEIKKARLEYLLPRCLSKSQTALTHLGKYKESSLGLIDELNCTLKLASFQKKEQVNDIEARKRLRAVFNGNKEYSLYSPQIGIIERYSNLAIGTKKGIDYILDGCVLETRPAKLETKLKGMDLIAEPKSNSQTILSAEELRQKIPSKGFDDCYSRNINECGYVIKSSKTDRCYTISLGKEQNGSVCFGKVKTKEPKNYVSIKYLGIIPEGFRGPKTIYLPGSNNPTVLEGDITREMKEIALYLKEKKIL